MIDVVIIDDEENFTNALKALLSPDKYSCAVARSREEGVNLVRTLHPDVILLNRAILDTQISTDGAPDPSNGKRALSEINEIRSACRSQFDMRVIVISGTDVDRMAEKFYTDNADALLVKDTADQLRYILPNLEPTIKRVLRYNHNLDIILQHIDFGSDDREMRELMRRLFWDCERVVVFPLVPGYSGAVVCKVQPFFDATRKGPLTVVKSSRNKAKVSAEIANYYKYVKGVIPLDKHAIYAEERGCRFTRDLAGFGCTFVGSEFTRVGDFEAFFRTLPSSQIDKLDLVVEDIFRGGLGAWQNRKAPLELGPLFERYDALKLFDIDDLVQKFNSDFHVVVASNTLDIPGVPRMVYHPRYMFDRMRDKTPYCSSYECVCHGDLRGQNVFVQRKNPFVWLIDFGLTKEAPVVVDFVKLETSIKYELVTKCGTSDFLTLEKALAQQSSFEADCSLASTGNEDILKAFRAIIAVRREAGRALYPLETFEEYLYALLFYTLQCFRFDYRSEDLWHKTCALVSASTLFEILELHRD